MSKIILPNGIAYEVADNVAEGLVLAGHAEYAADLVEEVVEALEEVADPPEAVKSKTSGRKAKK